MKNIYRNFKQNGFSLVEVLVAISILLLVLVGPLRIVTQSTNSTIYATEQTQAFFLAQEGLELIELARDNLVLGHLNDDANFPNPFARLASNNATNPTPPTSYAAAGGYSLHRCLSPNRCAIYPTSNSIGYYANGTVCSSETDNNCRLYINNSSTVRYRYAPIASGATSTPFIRTVQYHVVPSTSGGNPRGLWATSTVVWRTGSLSTTQRVELVTFLANTYDLP